MVAFRNPTIALSLLLVAGPLLLCIVLWARAVHGTVFCAERRVNRHGQWYRHWRFRTSPPAQLVSPPRPHADRFAVYTFASVSGLGLLLYRTRIELLPGLWNVLLGDIDLAEFLTVFTDGTDVG